MPGQVHVPEGGPSTSGRNEHNEYNEHNERESEADQFNRILHNNKFAATSDSGLPPNRKLHAKQLQHNLLYEKDGQFLPLGVCTAAKFGHYMFGRIENGYIRAVYNQNHKMVIIDIEDESVYEMSPKEAEEVGINKAVRDQPHGPPTFPLPMRVPRLPVPSGGRHGNRRRKN